MVVVTSPCAHSSKDDYEDQQAEADDAEHQPGSRHPDWDWPSFFARLFDTAAKITASIEPMPYTQRMPRTSDAMAKPSCFDGASTGFDGGGAAHGLGVAVMMLPFVRTNPVDQFPAIPLREGRCSCSLPRALSDSRLYQAGLSMPLQQPSRQAPSSGRVRP